MFIESIFPLSMFVILAFVILSGYPVAFVLSGVGILYGLLGLLMNQFEWIHFFNIAPRIWGNIAASQILVAVPLFIFMGTILEKTNIAKELLESLQVLFKKIPGGLGIAVILMGTIMATTTGIVGASVVMLSMMALPTMMKVGYKPSISSGLVASSGTLGILIPPSIMFVFMGQTLSISTGSLFKAAVIPGLILSLAYMIYVLISALFKPQNFQAKTHMIENKLRLKDICISILSPVFLMFMTLGSILLGWATPTEAAAIGSFGALVIAKLKKRLSKKYLNEIIDKTVHTNAMVFFILIGATIFTYIFRQLGGEASIHQLLEAMDLSPWGLIIFLMAIVFILGFFLDWLEISLIILPLFAPIILAQDFGHEALDQTTILIWFCVLVGLNLQTSFLTPPFGFSIFYLKGAIQDLLTNRQLYKGVVPFVFIQLMVLTSVLIWPEISLCLLDYLN